MKGLYETEKDCHKFFYLSQMNAAYAREEIDQNLTIKTYARFVKLLSREEMVALQDEIVRDPAAKLTIYAPQLLSHMHSDFEEFSVSRIGLFEDDGNLIVVDINNFSREKLTTGAAFMLFGRFNIIENGMAVFFVQVISPTGDKDKTIFKKGMEILVHYGIIPA